MVGAADRDADRVAELELLFEVTAAVSRAESADEVYALAIDAVARASDADRAAILVAAPGGPMRFVASRGLSETYQRAVEGHSPWPADAVDPAPVVVDDVAAAPAWATFLPVFRAEGIGAVAFIPLVHERRLLGKFMLYRDAARAFLPHEIQLAATLALHVANAVARHRSQAALIAALAEARAATLACEEVLSVVSHDLRNPIGAVLMGAESLRHLAESPADPRVERARSTAERIARQATRMARQIDNLVDFAAIQTGRIALDRRPHTPAELITAATELFAPLADERGLRLAPTPSALPALVCDGDRAVQVLSNLLMNALRVTPRGGEIALGAEARDVTVFYVRDSGPALPPDELARMFAPPDVPAARAAAAARADDGSLGLGLAIASGLVAAHGGRIWADAGAEHGTAFWFSLAS